jgi:uncharacterized protein
MAAKKIIVGVIGVGAILFAAKYFYTPMGCQDFEEGKLIVNEEKDVMVSVATTAAEQTLGLSGCSLLKLGQGMYFEFSEEIQPMFWMKDMVIPIDIIWIADNKVVGIEHNVPVPGGGDLTKYYAPKKINAVLEVGAGHAEKLNIIEGSDVQLEKEY